MNKVCKTLTQFYGFCKTTMWSFTFSVATQAPGVSEEAAEVLWKAACLPDVQFCWMLPAVYHEWWLTSWRPCWLRGSGRVPCTLHLLPRTCPPGKDIKGKIRPKPGTQKKPVQMLDVQFHLSSGLTIEKEAAACSRRPTRPISVKYFPEHMPSSSGDTTSSETADSSSTLEEIFCARTHTHRQTERERAWICPRVFIPICARRSLLTWKVTQPTGRYLRSSSMLRYSATRAALWTRHWAASAWLFLSECFPAMFWSQVRRRSGDVW